MHFYFWHLDAQKKLFLMPHSWFSVANVASLSLTIISKKFADEEGPLPFFLNTYLQYAPCLNKNNTLNYNSLSYAPHHTWHILALNKQI